MQNRSPLSALIALASLCALASAQHASATTRAQPKPKEPLSPTDQAFAEIFGLRPAAACETATPIAQVCAIPQDIADRCGMNSPDFDPHSLQGGTVALLAGALSNLRELQGQQNTGAGVNKCVMADQNIGAAVAALGMLNISHPAA